MRRLNIGIMAMAPLAALGLACTSGGSSGGKKDGAAGSGGSSGSGGGGGSAGSGGSGGGSGGSGGKDGGGIDTVKPDVGPEAMMPDKAPPPVNADGKKIVDGRLGLIGGGPNSCSNYGNSGADVWCGFYKAGSGIGKTELWVINASAAAAGTVKCDGTDGNCKKLTDNLWTETMPASGSPHPYVHSFFGDTLVYYADATSASGEHFAGPIRAWRPGWTGTQTLASKGYVCAPTRKGGYALCLDNVDTSSTDHAEFDYLAGPLASGGSVLTKQTHEWCCAMGEARKYSGTFTPDEAYFVWSSRQKMADPEAFFYKASTDLSDTSKTGTALFSSGQSQLGFTADSKHVHYLASFNYDTMMPSGTLTVADWPPPSGGGALTNTTTISTGVIQVATALSTSTGVNSGLMWFQDIDSMMKAKVVILRDITMPGSKQTIVTSACSIGGVSKDINHIVYSKNCGMSGDDFFSLKLDASTGAAMGSECSVATSMKATTFGLSSLTEDGKWFYWCDNVDTSIGVGDAKITDLNACSSKDVGKTVWDWNPVHSGGFIDSVDSDAVDATIRVVDLSGGSVPTSPPVVQKDAQVTYSVPYPNYGMVVYAIYKGSTTTDGLWVWTKLPAAWTPAPADGGATDATDGATD